jgi:hypothetical protein
VTFQPLIYLPQGRSVKIFRDPLSDSRLLGVFQKLVLYLLQSRIPGLQQVKKLLE